MPEVIERLECPECHAQDWHRPGCSLIDPITGTAITAAQAVPVRYVRERQGHIIDVDERALRLAVEKVAHPYSDFAQVATRAIKEYVRERQPEEGEWTIYVCDEPDGQDCDSGTHPNICSHRCAAIKRFHARLQDDGPRLRAITVSPERQPVPVTEEQVERANAAAWEWAEENPGPAGQRILPKRAQMRAALEAVTAQATLVSEEQEAVLVAIRRAWATHPHLRLCQLIVNATNRSDPFYVEDAALVAALNGGKDE